MPIGASSNNINNCSGNPSFVILGSASYSIEAVNEPGRNRAIFCLNLSLIWSAAATVNVRRTTSDGSKPPHSCKFMR